MVVHLNLGTMQNALHNLEGDTLTPADQAFLIRLLRELSESTEKTPRVEANAHAMIKVKIQGIEEQKHLRELEEQLTHQEDLRKSLPPVHAGQELNITLNTVLEEAFRRIENLFDAYIFTFENETLDLAAARAAKPGVEVEKHQPRPLGLTYTVARLGQPMAVADMENHPLFAEMGWTGAIIGIPLKIGPRVLGVMTACRKPALPFTPDEIRVLQFLADHAAMQVDNAKIESLAGDQLRVDTTTGLHNRAALEERLQTEKQKASDTSTPFSLFIVMVNGIGMVRDTFGLSATDYLIAETASVAGQTLRQSDFIARYDDDRWAILLAKADRETAVIIAGRIQDAIRRRRFPLPAVEASTINVSMGIATYPECANNIQELELAAEEALSDALTDKPGSIKVANQIILGENSTPIP